MSLHHHRSTFRAVARNAVRGLAFGFALGATVLPAWAQKSVKVGFVVFLSGPAAGSDGIPSRNAAELMVDAINKGTVPAPYNTKGLAGEPIDPVIIDESGSSTQVVENYRNLVQQRHVDAVIGYVSSGNCLAVAPVAEELKELTLFYVCGTPRIFEEHSYNYVFRLQGTATPLGIAAARYVKNVYPSEADTFAGINPNYAWGQDSWRDFSGAMKVIEPKSQITAALWPKLFAGQYNSEISTLLIDKPKIIHSSLFAGDLDAFLAQAKARNLPAHSRLVLITAESEMYTHGDLIPSGSVIGGEGPYGAFAHKTALRNWFNAEYIKRFGTPPNYTSYMMAQSVIGLKVAYDKAAKVASDFPSKDQVIKALTHAKFEGIGDTVDLADGNGHQGITEEAYGTYEYNAQTKTPSVTKVVYFPIACVNPPIGAKSERWIKDGMKGAKCP